MNKELIERIRQGITEATKRPTIAEAALEPLKEKIFEVVDQKVKPALLRPGDISGRKYLYVDPRIKQEDLL